MRRHHHHLTSLVAVVFVSAGALFACALSLDGFSAGNANDSGPNNGDGRGGGDGPLGSSSSSGEGGGPNHVLGDASASGGSDGATSGGSPSCVGAMSGIGSSMVRVLDTHFCIDTTEVTLDQYAAFLASSPAIPPKGPKCTWKTSYTPPAFSGNAAIGNVDWCDAYGYCAWAGKRLCGGVNGVALNRTNAASVEGEWHYACTHGGNPAFSWPYGNAANPSICLYGDSPGSGQARPVASNPKCVGPDNVFDLSGNVWEWEDACDPGSTADQQCNLRGGGFLRDSADWGSCAAIPDGWNRGSRTDDTGIRCCSDWQ